MLRSFLGFGHTHGQSFVSQSSMCECEVVQGKWTLGEVLNARDVIQLLDSPLVVFLGRFKEGESQPIASKVGIFLIAECFEIFAKTFSGRSKLLFVERFIGSIQNLNRHFLGLEGWLCPD